MSDSEFPNNYPCTDCEQAETCNGQDMMFCCKLCEWEKKRKEGGDA